jgi:hypothetical protein
MAEPTGVPSVQVRYGQRFSPEQKQHLVQKIQEWMKSKSITKCALCSLGDYEVESFRLAV